jgi:hypothetical protein
MQPSSLQLAADVCTNHLQYGLEGSKGVEGSKETYYTESC